MNKTFVAVDIETTGISVTKSKIIEIGAVKYVDGMEVDRFSELINPGLSIPPFITELTGISNLDVVGKRRIGEVIRDFCEWTEDYPLLGHNISFDYSFLKQAAINEKIDFNRKVCDTVKLARKKYSFLESRKLNDMCDFMGIELKNHHRAFDDAKAAGDIYLKMLEEEEGKVNFNGKSLKEEEYEPYSFFYKPKKMSKITDAQKKYLTDLNRKHGIVPDYVVEELTKNEASRKIDYILSEYGR